MTTQTAPAAVPTTCDPAARITKSLLGYGVVAGPVYVLTSVVQGAVRSGFDFTRHDWSVLANGSFGWIQSVNLVVTGLMTLACAVGLRRALPPGRARTRAPRWLARYAAGLIGGGVFRADPALGFPQGTPVDEKSVTWHGWLHLAFGGLGFLCLIAVCLVVARHFASEGRPGWSRYSRATGYLFLIGFLCVASGAQAAWTTLAFVTAVVIAWAWITALSVHLYRRTHA
ncbi:hypothetical protein GCM10027589_23810 [Actinocorallia lasiicapitis]